MSLALDRARSHTITPSADISMGQAVLASVVGSMVFWGGALVVGSMLARPSMQSNPFAGYRDFAACERSARRRGVRSPSAYCGTIKRRVEGA